VRRTTAERLFFAYAGVAAAVVVFLFLGDRIPGILVWLGWFGLATVGGVGLYHSYRSSRSLRELRAVAQRIAAGWASSVSVTPSPEVRKPTAHSPVSREPPKAVAVAGSGTFVHERPSQCSASCSPGPRTAQASEGPSTTKEATPGDAIRPAGSEPGVPPPIRAPPFRS